MVEFKTEILMFFQTAIIIIVIVFGAASTLAGNIQSLYSSAISGVVAQAVLGTITLEQSFEASFILALTLQSLGPPLVWGIAILGLYNPNWWLNSWAQWYAYFSIIELL